MSHHSGRHFLQVPGPSTVPDSVLRAISMPTIDHRGPEFAELNLHVLERVKPLFGTTQDVVIFPATGTGGWEAALVNTLSPGDKVLCFETGHFATLWQDMATKLGLEVDFVPGDWRHGVDPQQVREKLEADTEREIKAVCVVHSETSTGVTSRIADIGAEIDASGHPALLFVDAISSLGAVEYRHDEWGVDVTVAGSQKGLMLPPGLSFNAISEKALAASKSARLPRAVWDWEAMLTSNKNGFTPYTPAINLLYGLKEALRLLEEEGLDNVFARHRRLAEATRLAVRGWGLELVSLDEREHSPSVTAVLMPDGYDADHLRALILERFDMSLGAGLTKLAGRVFRIGHLGYVNELMLAGSLAGVRMGLELYGVPLQGDGLGAALDRLKAEDTAPEAGVASERIASV